MASKQSCSWCHTMNDVRTRWCAECGHAAHLPRCECGCRACLGVLFIDVNPDLPKPKKESRK